MGFKVVLVLGILALMSGCTAELKLDEAASDDVQILPPNPSGLLKKTSVYSHNMDDEMLSNVVSAIQLALAINQEAADRVNHIRNTLEEVYPKMPFAVIEKHVAYSTSHSNYYAVINGYDLNGAYTYFLIKTF